MAHTSPGLHNIVWRPWTHSAHACNTCHLLHTPLACDTCRPHCASRENMQGAIRPCRTHHQCHSHHRPRSRTTTCGPLRPRGKRDTLPPHFSLYTTPTLSRKVFSECLPFIPSQARTAPDAGAHYHIMPSPAPSGTHSSLCFPRHRSYLPPRLPSSLSLPGGIQGAKRMQSLGSVGRAQR